MASSKLRKAIGNIKDTTSISLAKVNTSPSLSDLQVAILKATRHDEYTADEKHIREIINLTSYSTPYVAATVTIISQRLNKTKNWVVAAKTLMLIQRLLCNGDPAYEQEIFFATCRGTRLLNMSDFRDSMSGIWDYSAFVRTYAMYLDQRLECRMQTHPGRRSNNNNSNNNNDEERSGSSQEMEDEDIFYQLHHLQQLLDRFLACRPAGLAKTHRLVLVALCRTLKESFKIYYAMNEFLSVLIDRFMELKVDDSIKIYEIFRRAAKQFEELESFYEWSKIVGILRSSEFPEVEKISHKKLDIMDEYTRDKSYYAEEIKDEKEMSNEEPEPEEDENMTKALPNPEQEQEPQLEPPTEEVKQEVSVVTNPEPKQTEGDLLNLGKDALTTEEHANRLALALIDGVAAPGSSSPLAWDVFKDTKDWETTLVQASSNLSHLRVAPGGGFDMLMLDGMYQQGANIAAMNGPGYGTSGSASSVALLALPAPPSTEGHLESSRDPFAASLAVAPPAYVQMSAMEVKQKLLMEEQMMWAHYKRDRMQCHLHHHT